MSSSDKRRVKDADEDEILLDNTDDGKIKEDPELAAKKQKAKEQKEKFDPVYRDRSPFDGTWFFTRWFFTWAKPLISFARNNQLSIDQMGQLPTNYTAQAQLEKLKRSWDIYKDRDNTENALLWAVLHAYRWEYINAMVVNVIVSGFELSTPFIMMMIIDFVQEPEGTETQQGLILVGILVLIQILSTITRNNLLFYQRMTGVKAQAALNSFIYEKQFRISAATNKQFSHGQMVTFYQVDAQKIYTLSQSVPGMMKLVPIFITSVVVLFVFLGWSFLSGIVVVVFLFIFNLKLGKIAQGYFKETQKYKDKRINATTEALNNIKMLKMYSWTHIYEDVIKSKRADELGLLWKRFKLGATMITVTNTFPPLLQAVIFSVYIGTGHTLELSKAYTAISILSMLQRSATQLPMFINQTIEFQVSMTRIQKFLAVNEVNQTALNKVDRRVTDDFVKLDHATFHWGTKAEEVETEDKKKPKKGAPKDGARGRNSQQVEIKSTNLNESSRTSQATNNRNSVLDKNNINNSGLNVSLLSGSQARATEISTRTEKKELQKFDQFMVLKDMNVTIKHGEFVCIIGDVASGKSSLLSALIGDMLPVNHTFFNDYQEAEMEQVFNEKVLQHSLKERQAHEAPITISQTMSYAQQVPWILNKTIRENIIFGEEYNVDKYEETINICELARDLAILPNGDQTEIGEKGINLSGGQKARIGLARAVYADREAILLDDPISALDAHVKKKIFKKVFLGKLKTRTRILVTHAIDFLHLVDSIILLDKGQVIFKGNYKDVKDNVYLKKLVKIHLGNREALAEGKTADVDVDVDIDEDILVDLDDEEGKQQEDEIEEVEKDDDNKFTVAKQTANAEKTKKGKIITDENEEINKVGVKVYLQYIGYTGGWWMVLLVNLIAISQISAKTFTDLLVGQWATSEDQHSRYWFYFDFYFGFTFIQAGLSFSRVLLLNYFSWRATKTLHEDMIESVFNAPVNLYFDMTPVGRILNRFSKDLMTIEMFMPYIIGFTYNTIYQLIFTMVLAGIAVPYVLVCLPVVIFFIGWVFIFSISAAKEVNRVQSVTASPLLSFVGETMYGVSTIRAYSKENQFINANYDLLNKNTLARMWGEAVPLWYGLRVELLSLIMTLAVCTFAIYERFNANSVLLSLLISYVLQLQGLVTMLIFFIMSLEQRMVNVDRCIKLKEIPHENIEGDLPLEEFKEQFPQWPDRGRIKFDDVVLKYRPDTEVVLNHLSFTIQPGEKVGIVGRTGAGKSTICLSLSRIVEIIEGNIKIDDLDIRNINLKYLRSRITVIPQDPTLFNGTLRFNLDPENLVGDQRIIELLASAKLDDLLAKDQLGLGQEITENGQNLSSGERQLICICRAILRSSKVVILDEATANIDVITEQKIQELINTEFKDSSMITIAHRLNTIIASDKVMVLSFGKILEYDSPQALMSNPESEFSSLLQEMKEEEAKEKGQKDPQDDPKAKKNN